MPERASGSKAWFGLATLVVLLDQASKLWLLAALHPYESRPISGFFNLVLVFNPGASFSLLADAGGWQKWFFIALALGISLWLIVLIRQATQTSMAFALALVLGGALGNLIDRLRFGAVIDFLDFHLAGWHWPAFNLADSAISLGVILLLFRQLIHKDSDERAHQAR